MLLLEVNNTIAEMKSEKGLPKIGYVVWSQLCIFKVCVNKRLEEKYQKINNSYLWVTE